MLCFVLLVSYLSSATCSEPLLHRRSWILDSFTIEEGHPGPFPYVLGKINIERDYLVYFDIFGEGVDEEPKGVLSIHKESGTVSVHRAVDYEEKEMLKLRIEVRKTDLSIDTQLGLVISIRDINDNPPRFQRDLYEVSVNEEILQGSRLLSVLAYDRDQRGTPNSTFHYEIKSVSPSPPDTEFFIDETGKISFKGCLDYEVAEMFTLLVEAKDHGEVVSLSSSTYVVIDVHDGNNHLPFISGQTGSGKVKEDEIGTSPLRLHVTDKDTPNSPAWRVRYTIQGEEGEHFKIETDPDTNDGILTVVKPLNFEEGAQRQLSISVENEVPYFSCKVRERKSSGLWEVDTSKWDDPGAGQPGSVKVIIEVEDSNDSPVFNVTVKEAMLKENAPIGSWIGKVSAVDLDTSHARVFVYKVGHDPAGWVTVDPHTGDITTVMTPDRESPHVVNGIYTTLLYAVDDGNPPMTGTTTLNIHVADENDNVPKLTVDSVDVCVSDGPTTTTIKAFDLDQDPFGGPFIFELLGDVKGKWKLNPSYGFTAGLVKEPTVYAGPHTIDLKISDLQGAFGVHRLSVTVCECSLTPNCRSRRDTAIKVTFGAIGIVFASLFLLLFLLLMAVVISCKTEFATLQTGDSSGETHLTSNTEEPGTDCQVPGSVLVVSTDNKHYHPSDWQSLRGMQHRQVSIKSDHSVHQDMEPILIYNHPGDYRRVNFSHPFSENSNQIDDMRTMNLLKMNSSYEADEAFLAPLHQDMEPILIYQHPGDYRRVNFSHPFSENSNQMTWDYPVANGYHYTHQIEGMAMNSLKMNSSYEADETCPAPLHQRLFALQDTRSVGLSSSPVRR
ncbi:cadherin-like protein 26 isoform X2 [Micropterus salmoides]|uniref:cadherin-like protein 26 isoform X2 n=1 Tax=Micropterus salmoides TaxID=27706 RepID=UPI0018EB26F9|nr:cadherin-like protein 26 isoform X2 [Micropterus salmoides]